MTRRRWKTASATIGWVLYAGLWGICLAVVLVMFLDWVKRPRVDEPIKPPAATWQMEDKAIRADQKVRR